MTTDQKQKAQKVRDAIEQAIHIQDFLWGADGIKMRGLNLDIWLPLFQKRIDRIAEIDFTAKYWQVEARKRLLQQAALSIQALIAMENDPRQGDKE